MRPVSGFERPIVQWIFVLLGGMLIAVAAGETVALRRGRAQIDMLRAASLNARVQQDQLESRLTREEAAREALTRELARLRSSIGTGYAEAVDGRGASASASQPALTLTPLTKRGAQLPEPTVVQPPGAQVILLRLVLPPGRTPPAARYTVALRTWSGGEMLWRRSGLAGSIVDGKPMVTALVTGDVFAEGAYEVALTATPGGEIAMYEVGVRASSGR
jgi:hypothetical protein